MNGAGCIGATISVLAGVTPSGGGTWFPPGPKPWNGYLPEVLDLVAAGRLHPLSVPTTVVDWEQADRRWVEPAIKMVVTHRHTG